MIARIAGVFTKGKGGTIQYEVRVNVEPLSQHGRALVIGRL